MIHSHCAFCALPVVRKKQTKDIKIHFCNLECKGNYQRLQKPVTKEWLVEHYINKKLDCPAIGKMVNRNSKSVWNWLKDFNIPTRPRGHKTDHLPHDGSSFRGGKHTAETKAKLSAIAKAAGRKPFDLAVGSYMKGRKGVETPNWKGGVTPLRQSVYQSPEWKEVVKAVWRRSKAKCERCGKHHNTEESRGTFHIHHIVSFAYAPLRTALSNLRLLCKTCHRFVHSNHNTTKDLIKEIPNEKC